MNACHHTTVVGNSGDQHVAMQPMHQVETVNTAHLHHEEVPSAVPHRLRPHSTPATLCWLERNYELAEGVCIPRNVVYFNYVDFCSKNGMQPVNAASFGKIIRQMFQSLTTRRLGTRGQSRYHYYGLAVKPESIYYTSNYSSRKSSRDQDSVTKMSWSCAASSAACPAATSHSGGGNGGDQNRIRPTTTVNNAACNNSSNMLSLSSGFASVQQLPEFPGFGDFARHTCPTIPPDRFQTLITMYRAHAQRIMDSVNKFSFSEIPELFKHFWQEIPTHIACYIGQNAVVTLIGVCDSILYRTILKAVLPSPIQMFPEDILKVVRTFADDIVQSLHFSLKNVPDNLTYIKMKLVKQLSKCLKRRTSVNHLFQAACLVITPANHAIYEQLLTEWDPIDWKKIVDECGSKACKADEIKLLGKTFENLLKQRASMAEICTWMIRVVETHVQGTTSSETAGLVTACRRFILMWNTLSTKVLCAAKQQGATISSTFHLMQLLLNELILHEIERLVSDDSMQELMVNIMTAHQPSELSDSAFLDSLGADFLSSPNYLHGQLTTKRPNKMDKNGQSTTAAPHVKIEHNNYNSQYPTASEGVWSRSSPSDITYQDPILTYAAGSMDHHHHHHHHQQHTDSKDAKLSQ